MRGAESCRANCVDEKIMHLFLHIRAVAPTFTRIIATFHSIPRRRHNLTTSPMTFFVGKEASSNSVQRFLFCFVETQRSGLRASNPQRPDGRVVRLHLRSAAFSSFFFCVPPTDYQYEVCCTCVSAQSVAFLRGGAVGAARLLQHSFFADA